MLKSPITPNFDFNYESNMQVIEDCFRSRNWDGDNGLILAVKNARVDILSYRTIRY